MRLRGVTAAVLVGLAAATAAGCDNGSPGSSPATAPAPQATAPAAGAAASSAAAGASGTGAPSTGATLPGGTPATAGTTAPGGTKCANSPPAMVGKALHLTVGKVVASVEGPVTVCAFTGRYEVLVRYQARETAGQFALDRRSASRLHQAVTAVGGLGDEAFFASYKANTPQSYTLAARKNGIAVFITSPAALGPERALMVQLLEKT